MKLELDKINLKPKTPAQVSEVIDQLVKIIIEVKKENDLLREQLNNNSTNSSLPPSRDIKKKNKAKQKSGKKQGGQPGHPAHQRKVISADQVTEVIECKPATQCECGGLIELASQVHTHQVFEIPVPRYEVIEYRIYKGHCDTCYRNHEGTLPAGVKWKGFGARAHAMVSLLSSKYRLSKRLVKQWFYDVYGMPMSVGSVSNIEETVSQSLAPAHQEVGALIRQEKIVHLDETGHRERNRSGWGWVASTRDYTCFFLNPSRGKKVAKEIIGSYHDRIIITDRYAAYHYLLGALEERFSKNIRTRR